MTWLRIQCFLSLIYFGKMTKLYSGDPKSQHSNTRDIKKLKSGLVWLHYGKICPLNHKHIVITYLCKEVNKSLIL